MSSVEKFNELERIYRRLVQNDLFLKWRANIEFSYKLYSGEFIASEASLESLARQKIKPLKCNLLAPVINVLTGVEIQNEYRIKANITNMADDARDLEDGLNQYLMVLQNKGEFATSLRRALKDCIIGGLGFVRVWYEQHEHRVSYIPPYNVAIDFSDITPNFSKQYSVVTWEDLHPEEIKSRFGLDTFNKLSFDETNLLRHQTLTSASFLSSSLYASDIQNRLFTFRLRETVPGYCGRLEEKYIHTDDKKIAPFLEECKEEEVTVNKIYTVCQGQIIDEKLEEPKVINGEIPIIPLVFLRDYQLLPRGLCCQLADLQESFNIALSRATAFANTEKIFIYAQDPSIRALLSEEKNVSLVTRPNAVVVLSPEDRVEIVRPNEAIAQQARIMEQCVFLIKKVSGIEDDSKGTPTNAVSGVAQQQRDIHSLRTNAFIYDNFKEFKKRLGKIILQQLVYSADTDIAVKLLDEGEQRCILLNHVVTTREGKTLLLNDVSAQQWNISIEQAPVDTSTRTQQRLDLLSIAQTPFAPYILKSKEWLGLFVSNPGKVMKEIQETIQQEQQLAQQANTKGGNNYGQHNF